MTKQESHTKFKQSKGLEGEIGAGSQTKELKRILLFQTFCQQLTQVESVLSILLPVLKSLIWILFISVLDILSLFRGIY